MIVVKVELHSAVTGRVSELGNMRIINDGTGSHTRGNYNVQVLRKGENARDANARITREGRVENHARLGEVVWKLVGKSLHSVGYDK